MRVVVVRNAVFFTYLYFSPAHLSESRRVTQKSFFHSNDSTLISMATVGETLKTLMEMGFSEKHANKALTKTGWKGVEPAMEWLLSHPEGEEDEDDDDEMDVPVEPQV